MSYHQANEGTHHDGIQRLQDVAESHRIGTARSAATARSGIQAPIRSQSEQARPEAETEARRWPRPCRLAGFCFHLLPASDQGFVSQPFSGELSKDHLESSV